MSHHSDSQLNINDPFGALFQEAEQSDAFWVSKAKIQFTEEMLKRMKALGMSKGVLAKALDVKPAQITRLCSGMNNFTVETMVRVARALNCEFVSHLQPAGTNTMWIDVLDHEPARLGDWGVLAGEFKPVACEQYEEKISHVLVAGS